jgi:clusterin-associated protein 1
LLGKEIHLRQARNTALGRQLELTDVENNLKRAITQVEQEIKQTQENSENISQEEAAWDGKIEKKRVELDRTEKRYNFLFAFELNLYFLLNFLDSSRFCSLYPPPPRSPIIGQCA